MDKIISLTKKLIQVPSTAATPQNLEKVIDIAKKELKDFQYKSFKKNGKPSVVFYNTKTLPKKFKLLLNGHLDVVDAPKSFFNITKKGGKYYGRGVIDMKMEAAINILAFKDLAKKVNYPLGLQLVTDEEVGGYDGAGYQLEKGINAEFVLIGEFSNFLINNVSKGPIWLKLSAKGTSAHGARLWEGDNAVIKVVTAVNNILKKFPVPKKESWVTAANIAYIKTPNDTVNKVPDYCEAKVDIRYIPKDKKTIVKTIKSLIPKGVTLEIPMVESSHEAKVDNKFVKLLENEISSVLKMKPEHLKMHGASDARHFADKNVNAVCFGPIGGNLHSDNEWADAKSMEKYDKVLREYIKDVENI